MTIATTSLAAYKSLSVGPLRDEILAVIDGYGERGCISDEILSHFPTSDRQSSSAITGRFSELERAGLIYRAGDTRPGRTGRQQKVMRVVKHVGIVPMIRTKEKRSGFLAGMMFAAKVVLSQSNLEDAKKALKSELIKASKR